MRFAGVWKRKSGLPILERISEPVFFWLLRDERPQSTPAEPLLAAGTVSHTNRLVGQIPSGRQRGETS